MQVKSHKGIQQGQKCQNQVKKQDNGEDHIAEQQTSQRRSWWHAPVIGYIYSILSVILAFLITKVGSIAHIHDYFVGVPFAIGTCLAGWIWGLGPAFVALIFGALCIDYWIIPPVHLFTFYKWPDIVAFIPFIGIQLVALYLIMLQKKYRRQLLATQQEASRQAKALALSNAQLEQADRVKDQFLSMASHELRTPVTSIHGYLQLLIRRLKKQSAETPELRSVHDSLVTVDQQTKRLMHLVNDLLDINSLRAGKIPLHRATCDLGSLCHKVVTEQRVQSERTIDLQLSPDPIVLSVDERRLSQVINNLVTNATKYSPAQTVVHVEVSQRSQEALLAVHNDGTVLSHEQQTVIFEPFYRSPEAQSSAIPGWGLGLAISKEIVERHHGRLWVESAKETGTTFFVALDLGHAEV